MEDEADFDLLEERLLNYPALAIAQCHRVMNGMSKKLRKNVNRAMNLLNDYQQDKYDKVLAPYAQGIQKTDDVRDTVTIDSILTTSDKAYSKANRRLSYLGGDRLRIHHTDICVFKRGQHCCQFCNLPVNGFNYSLEDIEEVIDFYLTKGGFRHILIGGGSEPISHETDTVLKLAHYIHVKNNCPIYLMCLPIQNSFELVDLYHAAHCCS